MTSNILNKIKSLDKHTIEVFKKSFSAAVIKVIGMFLGLAVSVYLGRVLGPEGLGIINLSTRIINIVLAIVFLGMNQVIIKEVAISYSKNDNEHIGNVMKSSYWLNGLFSLIISVFLILLSPTIAEKVFNKPDLTYPLIIALLVLTPQLFTMVFSAALVGYKKIWQSNLFTQTLSIGICALNLLLLYALNKEITINIVAACYAIGRVFATVFSGFYWNSLFVNKNNSRLIINKLLKTSLPLFIVSLSSIIATKFDIIVLGLFEDSKAVGLYSVASMIAFITSFFLIVSNSALAPKIATLFKDNRIKELEKMVQTITKGLTIIAGTQLLVVILFGKYILNIWGYEFIDAYWALVILSFGQFINISTGAAGLILVMTNNEKIQTKISITTVIIAACMWIILIPTFGIIGAATATSFIVIYENLLRVFYSKKIVNVMTIPIKFNFFKNENKKIK